MENFGQETEEYLQKKSKITELFTKTLEGKTNLPNFYYGYIAGIICEEPPMNA